MTPKDLAKKKLEDMLEAPLMWAHTKEALLARCSAILEMADVFDDAFYFRWMVTAYSNEVSFSYHPSWGVSVIQDALQQLESGVNTHNEVSPQDPGTVD